MMKLCPMLSSAETSSSQIIMFGLIMELRYQCYCIEGSHSRVGRLPSVRKGIEGP